jgi:hypothetical protein
MRGGNLPMQCQHREARAGREGVLLVSIPASDLTRHDAFFVASSRPCRKEPGHGCTFTGGVAGLGLGVGKATCRGLMPASCRDAHHETFISTVGYLLTSPHHGNGDDSEPWWQSIGAC